MSTAETFALLEAAQSGDEEAGERVLRENTGLIWSVVRRYNGRGVETEDLYQLGCIGFLKAVKGFDLTYGTQFSTYAVPKIACACWTAACWRSRMPTLPLPRRSPFSRRWATV